MPVMEPLIRTCKIFATASAAPPLFDKMQREKMGEFAKPLTTFLKFPGKEFLFSGAFKGSPLLNLENMSSISSWS